ncbi:MAG: 1,2-oxophytodienoate reductase [Corynebacterium sp.]|nr:1,2-oxophytodienoate reductase [Corynebacterium sp.]
MAEVLHADSKLLTPLDAGAIHLRNRIVQGPMGRLRADNNGVPGELMREFYQQRAAMGLLITDGTHPTAAGKVQYTQPGLATDAQAQGWKEVVAAVHSAGGSIVAQLMHAGWNTHSVITGLPVESPSAIDHEGYTHNAQGERIAYETPVALDEAGIAKVRAGFAAAAQRAREIANFDGVELHAANGYLLHQFLSPNSNQRDDAWGGSPERRLAFVLSVAREVAATIGAERVGIRISPAIPIQGVVEADPADVLATYTLLMRELRELGIAYVSMEYVPQTAQLAAILRAEFGGVFLLNDASKMPTKDFNRLDSARAIVEGDRADAVVIGRAALANPDLVARWRQGVELQEPDFDTFYVGGAKGYTDYPFAAES